VTRNNDMLKLHVIKNFFEKITNKLLKKFGKKFVIFSNIIGAGQPRFAVKSDYGFWYVGDILDKADISNGIANNGCVERNETELVVNIIQRLLVKQNRIIFYDVGANTGYYGILAAFIGKGKIKTFSFEPVKEHVDILRETIAINRLENEIAVFSIALGGQNGDRNIYLSGSGSTIVKGFMNVNEENVRNISVRKLDDIFKAGEIDAPDFIKIDVEGAEFDMLSGSSDLINEFRPIIFVEIISHIQNGQRSFRNPRSCAAVNLLKNDFGCILYCLVGDKLIKVGDDWDIEGAKMYLCLDRSKHDYLIKELCL
jgi:FkbM family methyltransferase